MSILRGSLHSHPGLSWPDRPARRARAHLWPLGVGDRRVPEVLGPSRDVDRVLRGAACARAGAPARGDGAGSGHLAGVPARAHAVAQLGSERGRGERLDAAAALEDVGARRGAGADARPAGGHVTGRPDPDLEHMLGACQTRGRPHRTQIQLTAASGAPSTTSQSRATAFPSRARRPQPTSAAPWCSNACSWPPSPSWPASRPCLRTRATPPRPTAPCAAPSGLGKRRWPAECSNAWGLENKRLAPRYDRLGFIMQSLLQTACILLVAGRLAREL